MFSDFDVLKKLSCGLWETIRATYFFLAGQIYNINILSLYSNKNKQTEMIIDVKRANTNEKVSISEHN